MVGKCGFDLDINSFPYLIRDKVCSFYKDIESKEETTYTREVKWVEKYYR